MQLTTNPILSEIQPQPGDQRRYVILLGYVGDVTDEFVVVYPTLDLRTHYKIPRTAILFAEPLVAGQDTSPTKLVVDATAKVDLVKIYIRSVEAGFLSGPVALSLLASAKPGMQAQGPTPGGMTPTTDTICQIVNWIACFIGPGRCTTPNTDPMHYGDGA
jgi:hypothetical protein